MFLQDADMERDRLRQGDILARIPFPLLETEKLTVLGQIQPGGADLPYPVINTRLHRHREDPHFFWGQLPLRMSLCAVLSNCCEVEPRHGKLLQPAFVVARLIPIKDSILNDSEKLESLRANRDPRGATPNRGYMDYFYIQACPRLDNKEWMVDFSQVFSIPNTNFPQILNQKILQMEPLHRVRFKIKAAVYFGRIADDEATARFHELW